MIVNGFEISPGVDLSGADLEGAIFAGTTLYRVRFDGCNLRNADFRGARLGDGWDSYTDECHLGPSFVGADLTGADFSSTRLYFTSFAGAVLRGANFTGVDLNHHYSESADALNEAPDFTRAIFDDTTVWPAGGPPSV